MKEKDANKLRKENLKGKYSQVEVIVGTDTIIPYVSIKQKKCSKYEVLKTVLILRYVLDMLYEKLEEEGISSEKLEEVVKDAKCNVKEFVVE